MWVRSLKMNKEELIMNEPKKIKKAERKKMERRAGQYKKAEV
jgi:hypothetical protein